MQELGAAAGPGHPGAPRARAARVPARASSETQLGAGRRAHPRRRAGGTPGGGRAPGRRARAHGAAERTLPATDAGHAAVTAGGSRRSRRRRTRRRGRRGAGARDGRPGSRVGRHRARRGARGGPPDGVEPLEARRVRRRGHDDEEAVRAELGRLRSAAPAVERPAGPPPRDPLLARFRASGRVSRPRPPPAGRPPRALARCSRRRRRSPSRARRRRGGASGGARVAARSRRWSPSSRCGSARPQRLPRLPSSRAARSRSSCGRRKRRTARGSATRRRSPSTSGWSRSPRRSGRRPRRRCCGCSARATRPPRRSTTRADDYLRQCAKHREHEDADRLAERAATRTRDAAAPAEDVRRAERRLRDATAELRRLVGRAGIEEDDLEVALNTFDALVAAETTRREEAEQRADAAGRLEQLLDGRSVEELAAAAEQAAAELAAHEAAHGHRTGGRVEGAARTEALATRERLIGELAALRARIDERESRMEDPADLELQLEAARTELGRLHTRRDAARMALDELAAAASEAHRRVAPHLNAALARTLPRLTRDRYREAMVGDDLSIRVVAPETGHVVDVERLSRGTRDQIALVQRLELARLLDPSGGGAPLLLDDCFAHTDEHRLPRARRVCSPRSPSIARSSCSRTIAPSSPPPARCPPPPSSNCPTRCRCRCRRRCRCRCRGRRRPVPRLLSPSRLNDFLGCEHRTHLDLLVERGELARAGRRAAGGRQAARARPRARGARARRATATRAATSSSSTPAARFAARAAATEAAMRAGVEVIHQGCFLHDGWVGYADFLVRVDEPALGAGRRSSYEVHDAKLARDEPPGVRLPAALLRRARSSASRASGRADAPDPRRRRAAAVPPRGASTPTRSASGEHFLDRRADLAAGTGAPGLPVPGRALRLLPVVEALRGPPPRRRPPLARRHPPPRARGSSSRPPACTPSASSPRSRPARMSRASPPRRCAGCGSRPTSSSTAAASRRRCTCSSSPSTATGCSGCRGRRRATCSSTSRATRSGATRASSTCSAPSSTRTASGATTRCGPRPAREEKAALRGVDGLDHGSPRARIPTCTSSTTTRTSRRPSSGWSPPRDARARGRRAAAPQGLRRPLRRRPPGDARRDRVLRPQGASSPCIGFDRDARCATRSGRCAAGRRTSRPATGRCSTPSRPTTRTTAARRDRASRWLLDRRADAEREFGVEIDALAAQAARAAERTHAARTSSGSRPLRAPLTGDLPDDEHDDDEVQRARRVMFDLLGYHRREAKPAWWAFFARLDTSPASSCATRTPEAIGDLRPVPGASRAEADRSYVWTLLVSRAGPQARRGQGLRPGRCAAEILELDEPARVVRVRRGEGRRARTRRRRSSRAARTTATEHEAALFGFAERVVDDGRGPGGQLDAAIDLLCAGRRASRPARPRSPTAPSTSTCLPRQVRALQDSALFVQGPPGSGKTWTGARLAVDLMRDGERVGVVATSHKAIVNLLEEIEEARRRGGLRLPRLEEVRASPRTNYDSDRITSRQDAAADRTTADRCSASAHRLALGAARRARRRSTSSSSTRPGRCRSPTPSPCAHGARSVVLLGDPQQLAHVSQGTHPHGSGASVLAHLLGEHDTVAAGRGVFLDRTWRMHPDVCRFVSRHDVRRHARLDRGTASVSASTPPASRGTGLRLIDVEHDDNRQRAVEEVAVDPRIRSSCCSRGRWIDRHGRRRAS